MSNKIGTQVGDYVIIGLKGIINQRRVYIARCKICGHIREMEYAFFVRMKNKHCVQNCGTDYMESEIGKIYGDFRIIGYTKDWKYKCACNVCGKRKFLLYNEIKNNKRTNHKYCSINDNDGSIEWKKFHSIWTSMRTRTSNPKCKAYKDYGERGITSDEYKNFMDFKNDFYNDFLEAIHRYGIKEVSIDRINNDLSYTKDNIRFTDKRTQAINTRRIKNILGISPNGEEFHFRVISDFASEHSLCRSSITSCLYGKQKSHKGWRFEYE